MSALLQMFVSNIQNFEYLYNVLPSFFIFKTKKVWIFFCVGERFDNESILKFVFLYIDKYVHIYKKKKKPKKNPSFIHFVSTIQVKQGSITFQVSVHWSHLSDDKNWQSESQKLSDYLFPTSLLNFHLVYFPFLL
jgi:hypothetical protein